MVINGNSYRVRGLLDYYPDQLTLSVRGVLVGGIRMLVVLVV